MVLSLEPLVPLARLHGYAQGAELAEEVHVGNFVEVKKSQLGKGTKAGHFKLPRRCNHWQ